MSATRYYRVAFPEALAALAHYENEERALEAAANEFAAMFADAKPVFAFSVHGKRFHGLRFLPRVSSPLWTKPIEKDGNVQRPRRALPKTGVTDRVAAKIELGQLLSKWDSHCPRLSTNLNKFWESIGTNWGNVLFAGATWRNSGGVIYVAANCAIDPRAVEITGSEYERGGAA